MKVSLTNGKVTVESSDSDNMKDVFKQLAALQEVFFNTQCQACKSENTRFVVRNVESGKRNFNFHEIWCLDCKAKLAFGEHASGEGSLFPKRKTDENEPLGKFGWHKFDGDKCEKEKKSR